MTGYLYLLFEKTYGKRYVGSTNDLERRIKEHNRKHSNSKFTKSGTKWELLYWKQFDSIENAREEEQKIKKSRLYRDKFYKEAKKARFACLSTDRGPRGR